MPSHDVTPLQTALISAGYLPAVDPVTGARNDDGIFGAITRAAMRAFEKARNLTISDQPTREVVDALGVTLAPDFPYQPIPPRKPSITESIAMFSSFPSIVRLALGLLPGLPDDVNKIRDAIGELVTDVNDKNGIEGLRDAARFARVLADEADKVANALDPAGAIQPTNPIVNK